MARTAVVIPNWNGELSIASCLKSVTEQTLSSHIIVVDNGSVDGSIKMIQTKFPEVDLVLNKRNLGFAGGVNSGISRAIESDAKYVALLNNDAIADKDWLKRLVNSMEESPNVGIATCKLLTMDKKTIDSTGDMYTIWGLPYPRGRGETDINKYDLSTHVFSASGGASIYRVKMLSSIGLFDEDFFAYYEDIDISFRAQLAGWKIIYVPRAIAYHSIGKTSGKIKGFTTYQTIKNLPWIVCKDVPLGLMYKVVPRFALAYTGFVASAIKRGYFFIVLKGLVVSLILVPKKIAQRWKIQSKSSVSKKYILDMLVNDLPPNAYNLRKFRSKFNKARGLKPQ